MIKKILVETLIWDFQETKDKLSVYTYDIYDSTTVEEEKKLIHSLISYSDQLHAMGAVVKGRLLLIDLTNAFSLSKVIFDTDVNAIDDKTYLTDGNNDEDDDLILIKGE